MSAAEPVLIDLTQDDDDASVHAFFSPWTSPNPFASPPTTTQKAKRRRTSPALWSTATSVDLTSLEAQPRRARSKAPAAGAATPKAPAAPTGPVNLKELKLSWSCPICFEPTSTIMSTKCGHLYCNMCAASCIKSKSCFICRKKLRKADLHPIYLNMDLVVSTKPPSPAPASSSSSHPVFPALSRSTSRSRKKARLVSV